MSLNRDVSTALITQFRGSAQAQDPYDIDASHGLYCRNCDFVLGLNESVQAGSRRGTSLVAQLPPGDGGVTSMDSWYFTSGGSEDCFAVYYCINQGVKAWDQFNQAFTGTLVTGVGPAVACFSFNGSRLYVAYASVAKPRIGVQGAAVYGLGIGPDNVFPAPVPIQGLTTGTIAQGGSGNVTAGFHQIGFIFTTRNGAVSKLCPVTATGSPGATNPGDPVPLPYTAADGVHSAVFTLAIANIYPEMTGGTIEIYMSPATNPNRFFIVPNSSKPMPAAATPVSFTIDISDNDLVEGTEVTQFGDKFATALLTVPPYSPSTQPFNPSAIFQYSSRMGYVTIDGAGFPVIYFSSQNAYADVSRAFGGIYLEARQIPVMGVSLGGMCYIATLSGLYSVQDNGDFPSTWTQPAHIDGSVGILSWSGIIASSGKILMASEKGLYLFRGGSFPQIPISYWQSSDWNRINWLAPQQVQIVDDTFDKVFRVLAPLKVVITGATNTSPIVFTTAVLENGVPVARPHLFQDGIQVTITGVLGNTAANVTHQQIVVLSPTSFSIPGTIGNGDYIPGAQGYSGEASPENANVQMCWNYSAGDAPGEPFYSLQAFDSYRTGAMATIRNIQTGVDETWFAPADTNTPSGLIRRVLPTDPQIHRDISASSSPAPINSAYETSLVPGQQDESITLHQFHGMHFRPVGQGHLDLRVSTLDHAQTITPVASPLTLSQVPGREILVRWALFSEQESIQLGSSDLDAWWTIALIRAYWTGSLMQR